MYTKVQTISCPWKLDQVPNSKEKEYRRLMENIFIPVYMFENSRIGQALPVAYGNEHKIKTASRSCELIRLLIFGLITAS